MTKRVFWFGVLSSLLFAGAALPAGTGCAGTKSCADLCAAQRACPEVTTVPTETCEVECKAQEVFAKAAACEVEDQEWNECLSPLEDVCNAGYDCASEALRRDNCYKAYCQKNPMTTGCDAYNK